MIFETLKKQRYINTHLVATIFVFVLLGPFSASASIYECRVKEMHSLDSGTIKRHKDSDFWVSAYGKIHIDQAKSVLVYEYAGKLNLLNIEVIQHGSASNSLVAISLGPMIVSRPRNYIVVQSFDAEKNFFWDHYGDFLTGICTERN